jgi:hypothetical protein
MGNKSLNPNTFFFITISFIFFLFSPITTVFAQNVFPISMGGQDKFYVDTDGSDGIQEDSDSFMTLDRVQLQDAGDDSGKYAVILKGHNGLENEGGYHQVFVIDGDVSGDGGFQIHESREDVTYLDDNNNEVTVKTKWAHIGENGAADNHKGFIHSIEFGMSDDDDSFSGYNKITFRTEHGTNHGDNINEAVVTLQYNNEDYVDTIGFDNGNIAGNVLTNIGQNLGTEYVEKNGKKSAISQQIRTTHSTNGTQSYKFHIPLDDDGSFNATDSQDDGLFVNLGMKPRRVDNPTPSQAPGTTGALQVTITPANAVNSGAKWRVDGGNWVESGHTVKGLKPGPHNVSFIRLRGWRKPADKNVTIVLEEKTTLSGSYRLAQGTGTLSVEISPSNVNSEGAQWTIDDEVWKNSGDYLFNISEGDYYVQFKDIPGWITPDSIEVGLDEGATEIIQKTYYLYGDADGNGIINFSDLYITQKMIVGFDVEVPKISSIDVVKDGKIDTRDSMKIFQYLLGIISSLDP